MLLRLDLQNRVKAEGVAIFAKSISLYLFIMLDIGLLAFALAQIVYCGVLINMYFVLFRKEEKFGYLYTVKNL
jgi:Rft protein